MHGLFPIQRRGFEGGVAGYKACGCDRQAQIQFWVKATRRKLQSDLRTAGVPSSFISALSSGAQAVVESATCPDSMRGFRFLAELKGNRTGA